MFIGFCDSILHSIQLNSIMTDPTVPKAVAANLAASCATTTTTTPFPDDIAVAIQSAVPQNPFGFVSSVLQFGMFALKNK